MNITTFCPKKFLKQILPVHSKKYSSLPAYTKSKVTINKLTKKYNAGKKITMITAYDYPTGLAADNSQCDITLVGDSLATSILGLKSSNEITLDEMIHHSKAVGRATSRAMILTDLPFGSYNVSDKQAIKSAIRLHQEGFADSVKLEGGNDQMVGRAASIINCGGIPVCGHIGLTPQSVSILSGFRVQGKTLNSAKLLFEQALKLEQAGCFLLVLEAMPEIVGDAITKLVNIPTIGIGAGRYTSGQVLVLADILDINNTGSVPKFAKIYKNVGKTFLEGIEEYTSEVVSKTYPNPDKHIYPLSKENEEEIKSFLLKQYNIEF
ncbi:hypothetical protein BB559_004607 [Furculomyces boomerangus]|uniref:3-methyl-2-oxobutanoate hydroxymethyltransferase n=2 Tax=Harpellales TaxID=61421 RepID=A0A2T9YDV5_9FUNG|nr:hypothetical protein BB559_004607 [Furculomyces boomerangus]PVZ98458.1 hypothetical protein BB558_005532 [Smittium angustum]